MGAWDYDGAALTGATATLSQVVEGGREAFKKGEFSQLGLKASLSPVVPEIGILWGPCLLLENMDVCV